MISVNSIKSYQRRAKITSESENRSEHEHKTVDLDKPHDSLIICLDVEASKTHKLWSIQETQSTSYSTTISNELVALNHF